MEHTKRWAAGAALTGVLMFGGLAATFPQQQVPPGLDVEKLAAELGLNADQKAELVKANELLVRRLGVQDEAREITASLSAAWQELLPGLDTEQAQALRNALRQSMPMGSMGVMGAHMGGTMGMPGMRGMGGMRGMRGMGGMRGMSGMRGMRGGTGAGMRGPGPMRRDSSGGGN